MGCRTGSSQEPTEKNLFRPRLGSTPHGCAPGSVSELPIPTGQAPELKHDDHVRAWIQLRERWIELRFVKCRHPVQLLFGTWLLLVGFLAFNPASTLAVTQDDGISDTTNKT